MPLLRQCHPSLVLMLGLKMQQKITLHRGHVVTPYFFPIFANMILRSEHQINGRITDGVAPAEVFGSLSNLYRCFHISFCRIYLYPIAKITTNTTVNSLCQHKFTKNLLNTGKQSFKTASICSVDLLNTPQDWSSYTTTGKKNLMPAWNQIYHYVSPQLKKFLCEAMAPIQKRGMLQ